MPPERPAAPRARGREAGPVDRGALLLPVLREAVREAVTRTYLRAVADDIEMSFSGLRSFLDGGVPRTRTVRLLTAWFLRGGAQPGPAATDLATQPVHVQAAIAVLVNHLPPAARAEAGRQVIALVRRLSESSPSPRPAWLTDAPVD